MNTTVVISHYFVTYNTPRYNITYDSLFKYILYFTSYIVQNDSIQATVVNEFTIAITRYLLQNLRYITFRLLIY